MKPARLEIYVQPRASRTELAGVHGGLPKLRVTAAPVGNAANLAVVEFVSKRLGIAPRQVRLIGGATSRRKRLEVDGVTAEQVAAAFGR